MREIWLLLMFLERWTAGQSQMDALAVRSTTAPVARILVHIPVRDVTCLSLFSLDRAGLWSSHLAVQMQGR